MGFDDDLTGTSRLQEMNQLLSQSEYGRPISPDDWKAASQDAEQLNAVVADQFSMLDDNPLAQRLAANLVSKRVAHWRLTGERWIDDRFCPSYDDGRQIELTRLYALVHNNLCAYPLANPAQYRQAAEDLLELIDSCQAGITKHCHEADLKPTELVAIKRGEHLCLFKVCVQCLNALGTLSPDSAEYTGPPEWFDDLKVEPPKDLPPNPWASANVDPWSI
ncbi:hypothetical protein [Mycolicibacterium houstonense]|uniref:hypothetical protein n=1 Tax=Mycolicibacterium houstonense TaxID=146021 RepID=UPI000835BCF3|nr:hypothetical protein [Mycolicibacterium houstonense]